MQEQKEHQEGKNGTQRQRLHHVGDRVADEAGLRRGDGQLHVGILLAELFEHLVHAIRHLHGVGARLLI